jgi:hypothetical protein
MPELDPDRESSGTKYFLLVFPGWGANTGYFCQGILKGKYHCTVDFLFDWFGISCITNDIFLIFKTD